MSVKSLTAPWPNPVEASPLARFVGSAVRGLFGRLKPAARCAERALAVEERVALGPKKALVVVRCHGQRFLVATTADGVGPILEIAGPKPARRTRREPKA
jgi:hypothetical protein